MTAKPTVQAFLLADQVYQDRASGKWIIAGTFDRLFARELPTAFSRTTFAYVNLTSLRGTVQLKLKFVDMADLRVLMESPPVEIQSNDPNAKLEVAFPIPPFPMEHEGIFSFELHADDELIGSLRVKINKLQEQQ